ncbi:MAG: XTP/dITP diphosphatase [FCB group bacterium]|nr:XTP/dITP diphosphatase [FCB group bacterium]
MSEILLLGTGNKHKAAELAEILQGLPWEVKCLADFPPVPEPVEDGDTFEDNAILKAVYYGRQFDVCCVADDSGLAVDALGGAPGVYSARYAGEDCTYADNNAKLLRELASTPSEKRSARFICCAALTKRSDETHTETGMVEGRIIDAPRGNMGFGYDPLFVPEGYDLTFAEMSSEEKHRISHRGRAFQALRKYLEAIR